MSYFEPVKLPKKLAKAEQEELGQKSTFSNNKKINGQKDKKTGSSASTSNEIKKSFLNWTLQATLLKTRFEPSAEKSSIQLVGTRFSIAAFDLDSTLVDTKSHTPFPRDGSDWKWLSSKTKPGLQQLNSSPEGLQVKTESKETTSVSGSKINVALQSPNPFLIVVFSNQGGVVTKPDAKRYKSLKDRISQIAYDLQTPFWFYAATKEGKSSQNNSTSYRKPAVGMWLQFKKELEEAGASLDIESSFFVGDAAGRPKDFSDSDLKFAQAIGLQFYTPEEFF